MIHLSHRGFNFCSPLHRAGRFESTVRADRHAVCVRLHYVNGKQDECRAVYHTTFFHRLLCSQRLSSREYARPLFFCPKCR